MAGSGGGFARNFFAFIGMTRSSAGGIIGSCAGSSDGWPYMYPQRFSKGGKKRETESTTDEFRVVPQTTRLAVRLVAAGVRARVLALWLAVLTGLLSAQQGRVRVRRARLLHREAREQCGREMCGRTGGMAGIRVSMDRTDQKWRREKLTSVDDTGGRLLTAPEKRAQGKKTKIGGAVTHLPRFLATRQRAAVRFLGDLVFRMLVFGVIQ